MERLARLRAVAERVAHGYGLEIFDVQLRRESVGTVLRVTNLANGRRARVRVLDRGPATGPRADGVIIDVSQGAARALGFVRAGRAHVRIEVLRWGQ